MHKAALLLACLVALALARPAPSDPNQEIVDYVNSALDKTADPCQDFYQYACGGWIKANTPLPPSEVRRIRSFSSIADENDAILSKIVTDPTNDKLNTFYNACMDKDTADKLRLFPVYPTITAMAFLESMKDVFQFVALLHQQRVNALFNFGSEIDPGNPEQNIAVFSQVSLPMPRSVYLNTDKGDAAIRTEYRAHLNRLVQLIEPHHSLSALVGLKNAKDFGDLVLAMEIQLANISLSLADEIDPFSLYNPTTKDKFMQSCPHGAWDDYFATLGNPKLDVGVDVQTPSFFKGLDALLQQWSMDDIKAYFMARIIDTYSPFLSSDFVSEHHSFYGKVLSGQDEPTPRHAVCVQAVDSNLGELLGAVFAKTAFSDAGRDAAHAMVMEIEKTMGLLIDKLDWMDDTTRAHAKDKLSKVANLIGFPSDPDTYDDLTPGNATLVDNVMKAAQRAHKKMVAGVGGPSNRDEWEMTADTVNAYYDPSKNEMVFPAGILQTPFFNSTWPIAMTYGGAGMVMGHELTHGFDNQGKDYDGTGKLTNWWANSTNDAFNQRAKCIIDQYSKYEVVPGHFVNGAFTQGENIADIGGLKNSFLSFKRVVGEDAANAPSIVPGFTNSQLFFVAFAQNWCGVEREQSAIERLETDPHSPSKFRVIGPIVDNFDFGPVFKCSSGTPMNPSQKCALW